MREFVSVKGSSIIIRRFDITDEEILKKCVVSCDQKWAAMHYMNPTFGIHDIERLRRGKDIRKPKDVHPQTVDDSCDFNAFLAVLNTQKDFAKAPTPFMDHVMMDHDEYFIALKDGEQTRTFYDGPMYSMDGILRLTVEGYVLASVMLGKFDQLKNVGKEDLHNAFHSLHLTKVTIDNGFYSEAKPSRDDRKCNMKAIRVMDSYFNRK